MRSSKAQDVPIGKFSERKCALMGFIVLLNFGNFFISFEKKELLLNCQLYTTIICLFKQVRFVVEGYECRSDLYDSNSCTGIMTLQVPRP